MSPAAWSRGRAPSRSGGDAVGRRPRAHGRPAKDPLAVALFVKRAGAARLDRPTVPFGPQPVDPGLLEADARGRWGVDRAFGGRFVPETLMAALLDLETAYDGIRREPAFWAEFRELLARYVGRPTPVYRADRLAAEVERRAGREPGRLRLYLKREDLDHTGAHKINNALGQALLTQRLGKPRVIAETGAGQHGVATATACALLGLDCVVYMGAEDIRRQAPNVLRMRALGTEVREVTSGTATLKDAVNETMRDWVTNVATTHYVLGSAVGPHPFPTIVRDLQRVIGDEAAEQVRAVEGRLPDIAMACVGGGSNAIGLLARFIGETDTRLVGVEAAGEGLAGRHAAALAGGTPGVLHGSRSYLLQDEDGQVTEAHSISAGLDYPGIGPQLSALYAAGRLEILSATDEEALEGVRLLTRTEGILPALEPAHAIHALIDLLAGRGGGVGRARTTSSCWDSPVAVTRTSRPSRSASWPASRGGVRREHRQEEHGRRRRGPAPPTWPPPRHAASAVTARSTPPPGRSCTHRGRVRVGRGGRSSGAHPVRRGWLPGRGDLAAHRRRPDRRRRRPPGDRPALLGPAGRRRHAPARQHGRPAARCAP